MTSWEYREEILVDSSDANQYGEQGWELVCVVIDRYVTRVEGYDESRTNTHYFFKRPLLQINVESRPLPQIEYDGSFTAVVENHWPREY